MDVYVKDPVQAAEACIIWMHGLGADANDMQGLAAELPLTVPVRHVFLNAPVRAVTLNNGLAMRAWYDIVGTKLTDREDHEGILQSVAQIRQVVERQVAEGFSSEQIVLAGFSQGGAMALFAGLHLGMPLGGIVSLSSYLPMSSHCDARLALQTPIFIAAGQFDPVVLPTWTKQSARWLHQHGFLNVAWHDYPMDHAICAAEIQDLARWLTVQITALQARVGGVQ